jgi:peptide/nickel transport system substrate-binding protein
MRTTADERDRLVEDLAAGRIDRSTFLRRATAAGISASAASALVAAHSAKAAPTAKSTTLRIGPWENFGSAALDPAVNNWDYYTSPISDIFEPLATYSWGASGWELTNILADSLEFSKDSKQLSFKLKQGIQFHGGYGEMTAEDVKYSFERTAGLQKLYQDGKKSDTSWYATDWPGLEQVKTTGKYSGVAILKEPFVPLMTLTVPYATSGFIVSKKSVEKLGRSKWPLKPIGTGPYEAVSYVPNKQFVMKRFEQYGNAAKANVPSYQWDEINVRLSLPAGLQGEAVTAPLEAGDSDFVRIGSLDAERFRKDNRFTVYDKPSPLNYTFMFINVRHPKLKDIRVRQAIRYAIDVPGLIQVTREDPNTQLNALISSALVGHWPGSPVYKRDVKKAKALLAEAGVQNLQVDLADGLTKDMGEYIQANLAEAGIKVNVITNPPSVYQTDPKRAQLYLVNYAGAPDPFYQFEWFTCAQQGIWNWAFWCDKTYSNLEVKLGRTRNNAQRAQIALQMQKLMDKSAAFIWMSKSVQHFLAPKNIQPAFAPGNWPQFRAFKSV